MSHKFQVGDIVRRVSHSYLHIKVGEEHPVAKVNDTGSLIFDHVCGSYDQQFFQLVKGKAPEHVKTLHGRPKPPHAPAPDTYIAKRDQGKPQFDLLTEGCPLAQYGLVLVLSWAVEVKEYKPHSWQTVPEAIRRYTAALHRHLNAKARGERYDHESGLLHDFHILACATFIAELEARVDGGLPVYKTEMPANKAT